MSVKILAIESSCDETGAAVCKDGRILSNIIAGQKVHEKYGGVVPELASRAHMQNIIPVVSEALKESGLRLKDLSAIAFTRSPGLIGSLLVGTSFAKSLSLALNIPLLAVHHMQAHVLANLIPNLSNGEEIPVPAFPYLCLTASGGHTQIILCESPKRLTLLGETLDDAAGEAFDKSAKLLGLPYPGGPLVNRYASSGNPNRFKFPEPKIPGLNFSFSGLKTSILYFLRDHTQKDPAFIENNLPDICASIQQRIVSILLNKLKIASLETGIREVCLAGGVSANSGLRGAFKALGEKMHWNTFVPPFEYCTDNAGMIAMTGYFKYLDGQYSDLSVSASARAEWN